MIHGELPLTTLSITNGKKDWRYIIQKKSIFSIRKCLVLLFILFLFNSLLYSNPFFSTPSSPSSGNSVTVEEDKRKTPTPVLTSPTSEELAKAQGGLREKLASFFKAWETSSGKERNKILWGIIITAFIYGILHAAGPGHRKTVVFSLYLARKAPWYEPLITGLILALLHGGTAIALIFIFKGVSGSISSNTKNLSIYMEGFTYTLIIILALTMIIKESIDYVKGKRNKISFEEEFRDSSKVKLVPFLLSGIYPCPGAILILVLSFTLDILWAGITAVIFMSLGMAILIIFVAYLAWFGRKGLFITMKNNKVLLSRISFGIEILSYAFMLCFSLYISSPFFISLFRG